MKQTGRKEEKRGMILQLSVLIPNKPGEFGKVVNMMSENNVNCLSVSTYDARDFGVLHLIVDQPKNLKAVLEDKGYTVMSSNAIAVRMDHRPGYMNQILMEMGNANINIECMYSFMSKRDMSPVLVFRTEDAAVVESFLTGKGHYVFKTVEELAE